MTKTTIASLRRILIARRASGEKWRVIGLDYPGVAYGTLSRIVNDADYEPKNNAIRHALGIPPHTVTVSPLPCGCPPQGTRCKVHGKPTKYAPHPVMRRTVVNRGVYAALGALYSQHGIGEARYRLQLTRTLDGMTG